MLYRHRHCGGPHFSAPGILGTQATDHVSILRSWETRSPTEGEVTIGGRTDLFSCSDWSKPAIVQTSNTQAAASWTLAWGHTQTPNQLQLQCTAEGLFLASIQLTCWHLKDDSYITKSMQLCLPHEGPCAPLASTPLILRTSRLVHLEPEWLLGQERWLPSLHLKTGYSDQR